MPQKVSGKKYSECKEWQGNFMEYHHFRDVRKMTEGCRKISADITSWYLQCTPALTLQREKSGTPARVHHVKHLNSLCRMSERQAR